MKDISIYVLLVSLIYLSLYVINFVNANSEDEIQDSQRLRLIFSLIFGAFYFLLYLYFGLSWQFSQVLMVMIFSAICAYIDILTRYVYSFVTVSFGILGVFINSKNFTNIVFLAHYFKVVTLVVLVCFLLYKLKSFGWGDVEMLIALSLYLPSYLILVCIPISFMLSILSLPYYKVKKINIKEKKIPLCPYIAISVYMCLWVI